MVSFNINRYNRQQEVFNILFESKKPWESSLIYRILVLLSKHYGDDYIVSGDTPEDEEFKLLWKDYIIEDYDLFDKRDNKFFNLGIDAPFYVLKEEEIVKIKIERGLVLYGGLGDKGIEFGVDVYADVFTDIYNIWETEDAGEKYKSDYLKVQRLNREIFKNFLIDLERILEGDVVEYSSHYFNDKYLYKYGFKDEIEEYVEAVKKSRYESYKKSKNSKKTTKTKNWKFWKN